MTNQHNKEMREMFEKERRIKIAGFNGCLIARQGGYCKSCVAQATNYAYTGESDRRKSPHVYRIHISNVGFENWYNKNCTVELDLTSAKLGYQAATAAADAKYLSVIERLVEQANSLIRECDRSRSGISDAGYNPAVRKMMDAIALAKPLMKEKNDD